MIAERVASRFKQAASRDDTISRRMEDLYKTFKADVEYYIDELVEASIVRKARVKLGWAVSNGGFQRLQVEMVAADGSHKRFSILPEEPYTAASDIMINHGGYHMYSSWEKPT